MNTAAEKHLDTLIARYPVLAPVREDIAKAYEILKNCYDGGGKLLIAGNGGSCADAQHIVGELMKGFCRRRPLPDALKAAIIREDQEAGTVLSEKLQSALPAIALTDHQALNTAFANDVDPNLCFAQQVLGYGNSGDVFLGISTSGNAGNVMQAVLVAKAKGMKVIGLTGKDGGRLAKASDCAVVVPSQETYMIQELHLPVYHALCLMLEDTYFEA
ncbi:MAG: SIS domain-containing protein [Eubacteriales bacterium]|nr:SIS domain-containing protein [Eubacteriales bacterium]